MLDIVRVSLIVYINKRKSQLRPFRPTANNSDDLGDVCDLENLDKTCGFVCRFQFKIFNIINITLYS